MNNIFQEINLYEIHDKSCETFNIFYGKRVWVKLAQTSVILLFLKKQNHSTNTPCLCVCRLVKIPFPNYFLFLFFPVHLNTRNPLVPLQPNKLHAIFLLPCSLGQTHTCWKVSLCFTFLLGKFGQLPSLCLFYSSIILLNTDHFTQILP